MNFFKNLALGLLCFLLFLSLSIFGFAFQINQTILNPDFITNEIDELDVTSLTEEIISEHATEEELSAELETALITTVAYLESDVKEQINAAVDSVYDYLLGKSQDLDLALILKDTILNPEFAASLIDKFDISPLAEDLISEKIDEEAPEEADYLGLYLDEHLRDVITELEPWLKEQIRAATGPTVDYLLGESRSLSIVIPMEPVLEVLEDTLREAFLASPPAELAGLFFPELNQEFDKHFEALKQAMPETFEFDEDSLEMGRPENIAQALTDAEEVLEEARHYIGYFQLGYKALIGFMVLLVVGIILISREVRDITRRLGIPCLIYGAIEYAGTFVAKYFIDKYLPQPDIPSSLQTWLTQFADNFLAPLEMFSLGLLITGIILTIVSFVYKRGQPPPE